MDIHHISHTTCAKKGSKDTLKESTIITGTDALIEKIMNDFLIFPLF